VNKLNKRINLAANLMIVLVVLLIGAVLIKHFWPKVQSRDYRVPAGTTVSLPGVDWQHNRETLLLVLDTGCPYCTASAPFYQQIVRENARQRKVQLIAVLPQDVRESKQYLSNLNVPIDEVRQSDFDVLGVKGTPTLILINSKGKVMRSWAGKLPPEEEREVLILLRVASRVGSESPED